MTKLTWSDLPVKVTGYTKGVRFRRSKPILGYVGLNGSGKTLCAVRDVVPSLETGRLVYSTVPLLDPRTGEPHASYRPIGSWRDLLDLEHCDILLDEVQGAASSRTSSSMPPQLLNELLQLRKPDIRLRWTTTQWGRVDKIIREATPSVVLCRSMWPDRKASKAAAASSPIPGEIPAWIPKRLIVATTIDASTLDGAVSTVLTASERAKMERRTRQNVERWLRPAQFGTWYDTFARASVLDHVTDGGLCSICGGQRSRPRCTCAAPVVQAARRAAPEAGTWDPPAKRRNGAPLHDAPSLRHSEPLDGPHVCHSV